MSGHYIATRLHKAIELAPDEPFLARCAGLPHFVIDPTLLDILARSDVERSVLAMLEANIMRLPFPEMLIEMEHGDKSRTLVILDEYQEQFRGQIAAVRPEAIEIDPAYIVVSFAPQGMLAASDNKRTHPSWSQAVGISVAIALLMLNIQGVEKEVIEPTRLNRQRIASGKPAIPHHSVMRIAHVYDSDGRKHAFGIGRHMPVHLRAGHARRQHYGEANALVKMIYIPPVLVNFKPGDEIRQPKRVLAA